MPDKYFAFDAAPGFIKRANGEAALTAAGYVGDQIDQGGSVGTNMIAVINVEDCKVSAGNEEYTLSIVGSNVSDRSDGELLAQINIGASRLLPLETRDALAGDQVLIRFRTEKNETHFQYVDLHLGVGGAKPSITMGAHITKEF